MNVLDPKFYHSLEASTREGKSCFKHYWYYACGLSGLEKPGCFRAISLLGEEVLILRDQASQLRAFSNICRHRAGRLALGSGSRKSFSCRYHGWTYDLSGQLVASPDFKPPPEPRICLPEFELRQWGPLLFVGFDPIVSFEEYFAEILEETKHLDLEAMSFADARNYPLGVNWKLYVDNYLEGYHLPVVHPGLSRELDFGRYRVDCRKYHSRQHAPTRQKAQLYTQGENPDALYYWVYPNLMLNIYQSSLQTNFIEPESIESCVVKFEWYKSDDLEDKRLQQLQAFSHEIQLEDEKVCLEVAQNLKSQFYKPGPYVQKHESGLQHFHGLYLNELKQA